jgi:hypothetical protein
MNVVIVGGKMYRQTTLDEFGFRFGNSNVKEEE